MSAPKLNIGSVYYRINQQLPNGGKGSKATISKNGRGKKSDAAEEKKSEEGEPSDDDKPAVLRMTFKYKKKNADHALLLKGTTLINFGEILVIVGLPGQGKSAICEAIVCAHLGEDSFGFKSNSDGRKVLLMDTERHPDDLSDSYHNISKRLGKPRLDAEGEIDGLVPLSLSEFSDVEDLKETLENELAKEEYSLCILDGILDFCLSMNDDKDATEVVKWVRSLAVKHNVAVVVTIHPNKGSESIAGHLGGFLYRWARAILFVRSVKDDKSIKEITAEPDMAKLSHGDVSSFENVYISWDKDKELLMPCVYKPKEDRGKVDKMRNAFQTVLAGNKRYRYNDLVEALEKLGHAGSTIKRWITQAKKDGIIDWSQDKYFLAISDSEVGTMNGSHAEPNLFRGKNSANTVSKSLRGKK